MDALVLFAFDRPLYLKQTLEALDLAYREAGSPKLARIGVIDGGYDDASRARADESAALLSKYGFELVRFPKNFGTGLVKAQTFRSIFDQGIDRLVSLEDDIVPAPRSLRLLLEAAQSPTEQPLIVSHVILSSEPKSEHERRLAPSDGPSFMYFSMNRAAWEALHATYEEYERRFLLPFIDEPRPYKKRPPDKIKAFYHSLGGAEAARLPASQDGAMALAAKLAGVQRLQFPVAHAEHIGEWGEHNNPTLFKRRLERSPLTLEECTTHKPCTCTPEGYGQKAFVEGLVNQLGFKSVPLKGAVKILDSGEPVIFHGWQPKYRKLGQRYRCADGSPLVHTLWHSGWTGSDLLGEGTILADAIESAKRDELRLLWLEDRDEPPTECAGVLKPIWSVASMLPDTLITRLHHRIVVGLHASYPGPAKNTLAAVRACTNLEADLHLSQGALTTQRGVAVQILLKNEKHTIYDFLSHEETQKLLASAALLVHPSLSDTWPFLTIEAVQCGAAVIGSDAIAWMTELPDWAQDLCVARPAMSTRAIHTLAKRLLEHDKDRQCLVKTQKQVLESILPRHVEKTRLELNRLGFKVGLT